jgi:hypothetical protein
MQRNDSYLRDNTRSIQFYWGIPTSLTAFLIYFSTIALSRFHDTYDSVEAAEGLAIKLAALVVLLGTIGCTLHSVINDERRYRFFHGTGARANAAAPPAHVVDVDEPLEPADAEPTVGHAVP